MPTIVDIVNGNVKAYTFNTILVFRTLVKFPALPEEVIDILNSPNIQWFGWQSLLVSTVDMQIYCNKLNKHFKNNPNLYTFKSPSTTINDGLYFNVKNTDRPLVLRKCATAEFSWQVHHCAESNLDKYGVHSKDFVQDMFNTGEWEIKDKEPLIDFTRKEYVATNESKVSTLSAADCKELELRLMANMVKQNADFVTSTLSGVNEVNTATLSPLSWDTLYTLGEDLYNNKQENNMQNLVSKSKKVLNVQVPSLGFATTTVETYNGHSLADADETQLRSWLQDVANNANALGQLALDDKSAYVKEGNKGLKASAAAIARYLDLLIK